MIFDINDDDICNLTNKYSSQYVDRFGPTVYGNCYPIVVGIKNNNYPFLQNIIDIFYRKKNNKCC